LQYVAVGRAAPEAPAHLSAAAVSASAVRLRWKHDGKLTAGFEVEACPSGGDGWKRVARVDKDLREHIVDGLRPQTTWRYRIVALNPVRTSPPSTSAKATTLAQNTVVALEAEAGTLGSAWKVVPDRGASAGKAIHATAQAPGRKPREGKEIASYTFTWPLAAPLHVWARSTATAGGGSDTVFVRVDNGDWEQLSCNFYGRWDWGHVAIDVSAGKHTLELGIREANARVDRLVLTNASNRPHQK
jgi:hypothetical protein